MGSILETREITSSIFGGMEAHTINKEVKFPKSKTRVMFGLHPSGRWHSLGMHNCLGRVYTLCDIYIYKYIYIYVQKTNDTNFNYFGQTYGSKLS